MSQKMVERLDNWFSQMQDVIEALEHARENMLDVEWLDSFLEDYVHTQDPAKSIQHANREWDL